MRNIFSLFFTIFPLLKKWSRYPAFTGWIALSFGIIFAYKIWLFPFSRLYHSLIPYAILFLLILTLISKRKTIKSSLFFITGVFLFSFYSNEYGFLYKSINTVLSGRSPVQWCGKVISFPAFNNNIYTFYLSSKMLMTEKDTLSLHNKKFKCISPVPVKINEKITFYGSLKRPAARTNPYAYNEEFHFLSQGIYGLFSIDTIINRIAVPSGIASVPDIVRKKVLHTIALIKDPSLQAILQASFLGEKNALPLSVKKRFQDSGIYHLLAISGLHTGILISSLLLLLSVFPLPRLLKTGSAIFLLWMYVLFIGFIPSLFRAAVMATIVLISFIAQRTSYTINTIGVAGIIWLFISPSSLFTPGYQLSFAATFGIVTLFPILKSWCFPLLPYPSLHFLIKPAVSAFCISAAGFVATVGLLVLHFGYISIAGLFTNIVAVLCMSIALNSFFLSLVFSVCLPFLASLSIQITAFFLSLLMKIAAVMSQIPLATISIPVPGIEIYIIYLIGIISFITIDKKYYPTYGMVFFSCIFFTIPFSLLIRSLFFHTEIVFFDTNGHGVLTGLHFPDNKIWLVSSVSTEHAARIYTNAVCPWLRHRMGARIDAIILLSASNNNVHALEPILLDHHTARIITVYTPLDKKVRESFYSFCDYYKTKAAEAGNQWQFIPAPSCTATVYDVNTFHKWYEKPKPASLQLHVNGIHFFIQPDRSTAIPAADHQFIQHNDLLKIKHDTSDTPTIFSLRKHGAIKATIFKNKKYRIHFLGNSLIRTAPTF